MISVTRRLAMPIVIAIVSAGCGTSTPATSPSQTAPLAPDGIATPAPTAHTSAASKLPDGVPSPTVAEIARLQAAVQANPSDPISQRDLGFALLQRVRETADPTLYAPAAAALGTARALDPGDALVLVGIGGLQLGKHQFAEALVSGQQAIAMSPTLVPAHAVVVDALVELGRYDEADLAAAEMFGLRSNLPTLTRVSYLAELHGQLGTALSAMRLAARSPGLALENTAFVDGLLGNLLVYTGDPIGAATAYRDALAILPAHAPSIAGQGRLAVAAGMLDEAIRLFQRASDILPLPEYVIALGDAQAAAGRTADAVRSFKLARAEIQLFQATGVVVDLDLALFEADHGDPARALDLATTAYAATPTVRAADARGWALHRLGRDKEAKRYADEALRLGSRDPLLRYHAGAIAAALGDAKVARRDLELALATDAGFSATGAAEARRILASLLQ